MVTLVTGATGFLGQYLLPHLKSLNPDHTIYACALNQLEKSEFPSEALDLTDSPKVVELIKKIRPKRVYHLAGIAKVAKDIEFSSYFSQNTLSTQTLLDALASLNSPVEFFLASSVHVYGNQSKVVNEREEPKPESPYGFTKYLAEETLKNFCLKYPNIRGVVGRLYSCIGPKQPLGFVTSDICKKIKELKSKGGSTLEVGPIDSYRRFTDARDVVKVFPILLDSNLGSRFEIFNIAPPQGTEVGQMIQTLLNLAGLNAKILSKPNSENSFKGLKIDTTKMERYVPATLFRPLELTLKDILESTQC